MDLTKLGLSKNEAKAFESLLNLGKGTASQISRDSDVPYGRIYDVMASLESKELTSFIPGKAKTYVPTSVSSLNKFINKRREELDDVEKDLKKLKTKIKIEEPVLMTKGLAAYNDMATKTIHRCKKYAYTISPGIDLHPGYLERTRGAQYERNISTKLLVQKLSKDDRGKLLEVSPNTRLIDNPGVQISMKDGESVLIRLGKADINLLISDKDLIHVLEQLFLAYYKSAKKL